MTVTTVGTRSALRIQSLVDMRAQLADLQRQLGTGKKADTYAGLGLSRGLSVGLRSQLAAITSYNDTITNVGVRLSLAQTSLTQIDTSRQSVKSVMLQSRYVIDATGQTADQKDAAGQLDLILGALSVQSGDRYLFSGSAVDQPPVETVDHILNGDGARAGLRQVIAERRQADLGASGLGRLLVSAPLPTAVSLAEDAASSPFGFKLASVASTLSGATVTGPTGSPAAISVDLGAVNPNAGDALTLTFNLPDGSSANLTLTATTSTPPGADEFSIGATSAATAANLQTALTVSIGALAGTSLVAASAIAAGNDFFNVDAAQPPQRVAGPPFDSATALVAGTSADTVIWYTGEAGAVSARSTVSARVDTSISVSYGARANEQAMRLTVQNIAVFAAASFSAADPNGSSSYSELTQRLSSALAGSQGQQKISDIEAEIAGAQTTLVAATQRHQQASSTLNSLLQDIEGVPQEQVGAQILALQTTLQASLQTTAILAQTTILNYIR